MPKMIGMMRLGRDAELRYTPNNEPVTNLSLAYAHGKAGQDGKRPTQWIDATLWGKRAEALTQYLTKGGLHCFTLDELNIQTFQKQDGSTGTSRPPSAATATAGPSARAAWLHGVRV